MEISELTEKKQIEYFLRKNSFLHVYSLGDLDPFFWPFTKWYGKIERGQVEEIILLYAGCSLPTVLAITDSGVGTLVEMLVSLSNVLPERFYAHFSPGISERISQRFRLQSFGTHVKMGLIHPEKLGREEDLDVKRLSPADEREILTFYEASYPGNWFDAKVLETGKYYAHRIDSELAGIAGVHVYSKSMRVAALGNVTTRPDFRGRGIAKKVCKVLCRDLLSEMDFIGLNVKEGNKPAIACYEKLGFDFIAFYEEFLVVRK